MLALSVATFGVLLLATAAAGLAPGSPAAAAASGAACVLFAALYMASPTWRLVVIADADGLEVRGKRALRFRLAWSDVKQVIASPTTKTCFVSSGSPGTSLIVPGEGAHAPYDIEHKIALYDLIIASVNPTVIHEVPLLSHTDTE